MHKPQKSSWRTEMGINTNQPFLVTLKPFLVEPLHGNHHASPWLGSCHRMFINPPFKNWTKPTLSYYTIWAEVSCGHFQLSESKTLQIGCLQDLTLTPRSHWHRSRIGELATRIAHATPISAHILWIKPYTKATETC